MKNLLLAGTILAAIGAAPAQARLQLSINVGAQTFSCFDGQLSCDQSGGANNLLVVDQTVGGVLVQLALAQSTFGKPDSLQLSSSNIVNENGVARTITLIASDTGYVPPVSAINNSASLTFNQNIGATDSILRFFADTSNGQGAPGTPGVLLESVSGHATTDPDSFSGSRISPFDATSPFSMSEEAQISLIGLGSVTGFNQSMETTAIPEPRTWAMMGIGFALMGLLGIKRRRNRLNAFA